MSEGELTRDPKQSPYPREHRDELARKVWEARSYGLGRNETARLLGVSTRQVDNVSKDQRIDWGGDHVAVANHARAQQAQARRMDLSDKFLKLADLELQAALDGQDTVSIRKDRITIAAIATDKHLRLSEFMGDTSEAASEEEASEGLTRMMAAIYATADDDHPDDH